MTKPVELHKIQGTYRKHRHGNESMLPKPNADVGKPPNHLNAVQRRIWREIIKISPDGVLKESDRIQLEVAACLLAEFRYDPLIFQSARLAHLQKALGNLGLNPVDRNKIVVPVDNDENDPWANL